MTPRRVATATKSEPKKTWQLVELHGCWWAYEGELPPSEAFTTHSRSGNLPILGPFPSRAMAEARLQGPKRRQTALLRLEAERYRGSRNKRMDLRRLRNGPRPGRERRKEHSPLWANSAC